MQHTVEELCEAVERFQLMPSKDLAAMRARWFRPTRQGAADVDKFCRWVVLNGYLSEFVVGVLMSGKGAELELNQYRLRDRLTTGPMAGAYLGTDPLSRPVAIEILAAANARDPAVAVAFQEAARQAMRVDHP